MSQLPIYIICHKLDYHLAQICVASIRYFYPKVAIFLVKDEIHGKFQTQEVEQRWQVEIANLDKKIFGWTTAKVFLLLSKKLKHQKILVLDADVAFIGKVIEKLSSAGAKYDFVVSPEYKDKPNSAEFKRLYYDFNYFKKIFPGLLFPGFTFNSGNIVITPGLLPEKRITMFFCKKRYPFWTKLGKKTLPLRDQSLLNVFLPILAKEKKIRLQRVRFMYWYLDKEVEEITIAQIKTGTIPYLIHWAGADKHSFVAAMKHGKLLLFFQKHYYSRLPLGSIRFRANYFLQGARYILKKWYPTRQYASVGV